MNIAGIAFCLTLFTLAVALALFGEWWEKRA
jgi:hypothetical protein